MNHDSLKASLVQVASDDAVAGYDEIRTKQAIVQKILHILDWDVFSPREVEPEHSVEHRRVDYSLNLQGRPRVFIEAKKPAEDLERHEEQLLDYAFREGVELAILTNGITWWFYLPTKPGPWSSRKFVSIDLRAPLKTSHFH
jgi:predicted type IV restriction endonuclease